MRIWLVVMTLMKMNEGSRGRNRKRAVPAKETLESSGTLVLVPNQRKSHPRIQEEDGAREVETGFPSSDDAAESTIARLPRSLGWRSFATACIPWAPSFPVLTSAN